MWDLLILGAGPAGCAAAIEARRSGLAVLIIAPAGRRRPTPGETLHPGIEPILAQLGLRATVLAENFHRHLGIWIEWDEARSFEAYGEDERGPWRGFQADRRKLNDILLNAALDLGVELINSVMPEAIIVGPTGVNGVIASGAEFRARWTADATGRQAWLARKLDLTRTCCSPPMIVRFGWSNDVDVKLDGQPRIKTDPQGWSWVAPLGGAQSAWVSLVVAKPNETLKTRSGTDVSWRIYRGCVGLGYFLLGDAAAILDPLSSHGVLRALMSGMFCGHLIFAHKVRRLSEADIIRHYALWLTQQFDLDVAELSALYRRHPSKELANMFCALPYDGSHNHAGRAFWLKPKIL